MKNISVPNDDPILNRTESFTFCLRFYLEVLGTTSNQMRGNVIQIGYPNRLIQLWAVYPNRESRQHIIRRLLTCCISQTHNQGFDRYTFFVSPNQIQGGWGGWPTGNGKKLLQPSMLPGPAVPGSCLAFFHFRWAIHPIRPVWKLD